ncbi:MAG: DUF5615 family PIN-like protein [Balneolales bacterium]
MKFLADECCDVKLVAQMHKAGFDVLHILENQPGLVDDDLLDKAYTEQRILITEDKDFGELVYRLNKPAYGIILLRFDKI